MIITCPNCYTKYMVPAQKLGGMGRMVRCSRCHTQWHQEAPATQQQYLGQEAPRHIANPRLAIAGNTLGGGHPFERDSYQPGNLPVVASAQEQKRQMFNTILAAVLVLAGIFGSILLLRDSLVKAIPMMGAVFEPFETPSTQTPQAATVGLVIGDIQRDVVDEDGFVTYIIQGKVTNTNLTDKEVPNLRIALLNEKGVQLDAWRVQPQKRVLKSGESTDWICHFYNPPLDKVSEYQVNFAKQ